jgi:hypothetical protein
MSSATFTCEWNPTGAAWADITASVIAIDGDFSTSGQGNGIGFGDSSDASARVTVSTVSLSVATWAYVPLRVQFTVDANVARGVFGVVTDIDEDESTAELTVTGFKQLISRVRLYSGLFTRRPIATKTTASSIDDPADGGYVAGPLNWLLWQAGGRPYEQAASYPTATFYYSLSQAPIAPKYSWIAGEDGWEEALRMVRAAGGQLYQRPDGVIAYVSPLSIAGGTPQFALDQDSYAEIRRTGSASDLVASYTTTYLPRLVSGMQEVVSDTTPRVIAAGATVTIELEPQYPLSSIDSVGDQLPSDAISATSFDGTQAESSSDYTHTTYLAAQLITIVFENVSAQPFVIEKITIRGTPVVPTEAGTVTVGSGAPTLSIEQNPYIQSRSHAQRLARMALDFYDEVRPVISVSGVLYDPEAHQVGTAGTLTVAAWGLSSAPIVILGVSHGDTGITADLEVLVTTGLPALADFFLVSTSAQVATKRIGY